jgi:hypothetical protein
MKLHIDESYPGELRDLEQIRRKVPEAMRKAAEQLGVRVPVETYQSHSREPEPGDRVRNVNPGCIHFESEGVATRVDGLSKGRGKTCSYRTTNSGDEWTKGDVLCKTLDQLAPMPVKKGRVGGEIDVFETLVEGTTDLYKRRLELLEHSLKRIADKA